MSNNITLAIIRDHFPGRVALSPTELAPLIMTTARSLRLAVAAGNCPIAHRRVGGRILFPIGAIAAYLDDGISAENQKRRPGRPRKTK